MSTRRQANRWWRRKDLSVALVRVEGMAKKTKQIEALFAEYGSKTSIPNCAGDPRSIHTLIKHIPTKPPRPLEALDEPVGQP